MKEPSEMNPEDDKFRPETNKKRTFKTPLQLEELEKFYKEHTYPTEKMKADFAKKVGLSEKQVSGWFCHRRLKDKRLLKEEARANGRQDLSSGVIQDHGSGLKQDSCSSNKQGTYRHFDPIEVESRRFDIPDFTTTDNAFRKRSKRMTTGNYNTLENTSSGSSSTSQERLFPQRESLETPYNLESFRYPSRITKGVENKVKMMASGYLHLQVEAESVAIIAVKRQLGGLFREDGPSLGIEFQPLPPGAFASPVLDPINVPYQTADPTPQNSHGIFKGCKEPRIESRYPSNHHEMYPQCSYPDDEHVNSTKSESVHRQCISYTSMGNSSFNSYRNHTPEGNPSMDDNMDESSEDEAPMINYNNNFIRSKYGVEGVRSHSTKNHRLRPPVRKFVSGESHVQLHKYDDRSACMPQMKKYLESKSLNLVNRHREALDAMGREENVCRDRRAKKYENPVRVKKNLKNEMRASGRDAKPFLRGKHCSS